MIPMPPNIPVIAPDEVEERLRSGSLLIDVREANEWSAGRIAGSELKPMSEINDWYPDLPRDQEIIIYCRTGQRSGQVVRALVEQADFANVFNMTGGIVAWARAGFEVAGPIED